MVVVMVDDWVEKLAAATVSDLVERMEVQLVPRLMKLIECS